MHIRARAHTYTHHIHTHTYTSVCIYVCIADYSTHFMLDISRKPRRKSSDRNTCHILSGIIEKINTYSRVQQYACRLLCVKNVTIQQQSSCNLQKISHVIVAILFAKFLILFREGRALSEDREFSSLSCKRFFSIFPVSLSSSHSSIFRAHYFILQKRYRAYLRDVSYSHIVHQRSHFYLCGSPRPNCDC